MASLDFRETGARVTFDPERNHRRSIRLKGYDYSSEGAYFITICTKDRECFLGEIAQGEARINPAGNAIKYWWIELQNKFENIELDEYIIMPNHIHGIIYITNVGADLRVCPAENRTNTDKGEHIGSPLHRFIQWFKTMSINEYIAGVNHYGWHRFNGKLWQRNYYERIIRDKEELNRVREYIANNPMRWAEDENNPVNIKPFCGYDTSR